MATKKKAKTARGSKITLIESESKTPTIKAAAGMRVEIVSIARPSGRPARLGARLCGYGSGYCLAIIEAE